MITCMKYMLLILSQYYTITIIITFSNLEQSEQSTSSAIKVHETVVRILSLHTPPNLRPVLLLDLRF